MYFINKLKWWYQNSLTVEIVRSINNKGYEIKLFNVRKLTREILDEHYAYVKDRDFYLTMKEFMLSDYVVPMIVYGENTLIKTKRFFNLDLNHEDEFNYYKIKELNLFKFFFA